MIAPFVENEQLELRSWVLVHENQVLAARVLEGIRLDNAMLIHEQRNSYLGCRRKCRGAPENAKSAENRDGRTHIASLLKGLNAFDVCESDKCRPLYKMMGMDSRTKDRDGVPRRTVPARKT
ncbi:MAG TPA: hypothetical protein VLV78_11345 [Thermoanaerobaculia bacterium]|nr:hypothetical protein [Thermoanaerobaculia bacterium]